jgi:hypothetical protein
MHFPDPFGIFDLITLLIDSAILILWLVARSYYFARGGQPSSVAGHPEEAL